MEIIAGDAREAWRCRRPYGLRRVHVHLLEVKSVLVVNLDLVLVRRGMKRENES